MPLVWKEAPNLSNAAEVIDDEACIDLDLKREGVECQRLPFSSWDPGGVDGPVLKVQHQSHCLKASLSWQVQQPPQVCAEQRPFRTAGMEGGGVRSPVLDSEGRLVLWISSCRKVLSHRLARWGMLVF